MRGSRLSTSSEDGGSVKPQKWLCRRGQEKSGKLQPDACCRQVYHRHGRHPRHQIHKKKKAEPSLAPIGPCRSACENASGEGAVLPLRSRQQIQHRKLA